MGIVNMNAAKTPRFKIGSESEQPDKVYQEEIQDLRVEKLSHRVTLLTILIPCLIGVVLVITYMDIKDRLTVSQTTGSQGMQALSKEVESKFSQLSLKDAKLEELINQKLPALEKNTAVIQARLRSAQKSIAKIQSSMAEKSAVEQALAEINQTLAPLPQRLDTLAEKTKGVDDKLFLEIAGISTSITAVNEALLKIETELIALDAGKVDKEALDAQLQAERQALQLEWQKRLKKLENSIASLKQAAQTTAPSKTTAPAAGSKPTAPSPPPAPQSKTAPAPKPATPPVSPPPPGKIIEQDID